MYHVIVSDFRNFLRPHLFIHFNNACYSRLQLGTLHNLSCRTHYPRIVLLCCSENGPGFHAAFPGNFISITLATLSSCQFPALQLLACTQHFISATTELPCFHVARRTEASAVLHIPELPDISPPQPGLGPHSQPSRLQRTQNTL